MILLALACRSEPVPIGPDVVVITVDTLRHDAIDHPSMQALAGAGTRYTQATTPLLRTTPALASLWTGLEPHRHGSLEVGEAMEAAHLAEIFQGAGYATLAVSGSRVAAPEQGLGAGFDRFEVLDDPSAEALTDRALELLPSDGPRLLWVHYTDPHFPYLPPDASEGPCRQLGRRAAKGKLRRDRLFMDLEGVASGALSHCRELYAGEVAHADAAIGRLLEAFDAPLVALTSDHGENLGEWGLFYEHGPNVHPATLRVPLLLSGPGVEVGEDSGIARLQDVVVTLMGLVGLPVPEGLDGVDLRGPRPEVAAALSGSALHPRLSGYLRAGRADKRHCLHGPRYSLCSDGFFDHQADPGLETDLSGSLPEEESTLADAAARWPPERARQLVARSLTHSLVARPELQGYAFTLYANDDMDHPIDDPAMVEVLRPWLPSPPSGAPSPVASEEALRALGYLE